MVLPSSLRLKLVLGGTDTGAADNLSEQHTRSWGEQQSLKVGWFCGQLRSILASGRLVLRLALFNVENFLDGAKALNSSTWRR